MTPIDTMPGWFWIPLALILWGVLAWQIHRDRTPKPPRPVSRFYSLDCLSRVHGGCQYCYCACHGYEDGDHA